MNRSDLKKLVAYLAVVGILFTAYYGNYLPLRKSQSFIYFTRMAGSVRSWEQLQSIMDEPLNRRSPIGQEEIVRSMTNMLLSVIRANGQNPQLTGAVVEFVENQYRPIMERGRGMSFQQNLYILGYMNQMVFTQIKDPAYLDRSENYFRAAIELAPKRPQSLYGLLDVHRLRGDEAKIKEVADRILSLWPSDASIRALADSL